MSKTDIRWRLITCVLSFTRSRKQYTTLPLGFMTTLNTQEIQAIDGAIEVINSIASYFCSLESLTGMERAGIIMVKAMIPQCHLERERILKQIIDQSHLFWKKKPFHQEKPRPEDLGAVIGSLPLLVDNPSMKERVLQLIVERVDLNDHKFMVMVDCLIWSLINYIAAKRRPELSKDGMHQPTIPFMKEIKLGEIMKDSGRKRISLSELL